MTTLNDARMPSLADKIAAEEAKVKAEKVEVKKEKVVKKTKKK